MTQKQRKSKPDYENSSVKFLHWKMQGNTTYVFHANMPVSLGTVSRRADEGETTDQWYQQVHKIGGPKYSRHTCSCFSYMPDSLVLELPLSIHASNNNNNKSSFTVKY